MSDNISNKLLNIYKQIDGVLNRCNSVLIEKNDGTATDIYNIGDEINLIGKTYPFSYKKIKRLTDGSITKVRRYTFSGCTSLTSVNLPACSSVDIYTFSGCTSLTSVNLPMCSYIGANAFEGCNSLTSIDLPMCSSVNSYTFSGCTSLTSIDLPMCSSINNYAFCGCTSLTSIDLPMCSSVNNYAFTACTSLTSVVFRYQSVVSLPFSGAFNNTPMLKSTYTGSFGSIYVPASLVDAYKVASNWSYYADRITAIPE